MRAHAAPGMSTAQLDEYGLQLLKEYGARSAPKLAYNFPGSTCISINHQVAHGVPSNKTILKEGDLINIDVSAELDGYWADNGGSFVIGKDINNHAPLINASKEILKKAIGQIKADVRIADIGKLIHQEAKKLGYQVIKNLTGHGVGRSLHEEPREIANYKDLFDFRRFKNNSVIAVETFISTQSSIAEPSEDKWTLIGTRGGFVAQHEHTLIVTENKPTILTLGNGIWD